MNAHQMLPISSSKANCVTNYLVARCTFDFSLARRRGSVEDTVMGSRVVERLLRNEAFDDVLESSERDKSIVDE
jgi:hypothetical protein